MFKYYKVFVGYPDKDLYASTVVRVDSTDTVDSVAYGVWLGWSMHNDIHNSNYYYEEIEDSKNS